MIKFFEFESRPFHCRWISGVAISATLQNLFEEVLMESLGGMLEICMQH